MSNPFANFNKEIAFLDLAEKVIEDGLKKLKNGGENLDKIRETALKNAA